MRGTVIVVCCVVMLLTLAVVGVRLMSGATTAPGISPEPSASGQPG